MFATERGIIVAWNLSYRILTAMKQCWKIFLMMWLVGTQGAHAQAPNLIWIMADDLGYGELGCYGQKVIPTPHIDRMAKEGMRFTHYYSGATVCAPSRCVLMTGLHQGHARVRGNKAAVGLTKADVSVATVLQQAGYRTACIGKWGLGEHDGTEEGLPKHQGFDRFFGYLNHTHAHNHFPDYLWRDDAKEKLPNVVVPVGAKGGGYATKAVAYADDLFADEALKFVSEKSTKPFFLYWSMVSPHANNERQTALGDGANVPDYGDFADKPWPVQDRGHAAMIARLDRYVGRMLEQLQTLGIAQNTLVIFTSDNGPHKESGHDLTRFQPSGPFTGIKRSLTDGGIRVPFIAWWPGKVPAGASAEFVGSFADWWPTAAELAKAKTSTKVDGVSIVPTLLGKSQAPQEFLYWEFHEGGFSQAALYQGRWKGIRRGGPDQTIVLYDTENDIAEKTNVAAKHPEIARKISDYLKQARTESADWVPEWKAASTPQKKQQKR
jgi:arylsulfatase A-like enzyme